MAGILGKVIMVKEVCSSDEREFMLAWVSGLLPTDLFGKTEQ